MTIVMLVEGETEIALRGTLQGFLNQRSHEHGVMRRALRTKKIASLNLAKLGRQIALELQTPGVDSVIALIDVFPNHRDAMSAKQFLSHAARRSGVTQRFYPHVAQYDVEAWLLPFWDDICQRVGVRQGRPSPNPETVNGINPPSYRLADLYSRARNPARKYVKTIEMPAILRGKDLGFAANACPELKSLLNTLLACSNLPSLP